MLFKSVTEIFAYFTGYIIMQTHFSGIHPIDWSIRNACYRGFGKLHNRSLHHSVERQPFEHAHIIKICQQELYGLPAILFSENCRHVLCGIDAFGSITETEMILVGDALLARNEYAWFFPFKQLLVAREDKLPIRDVAVVTIAAFETLHKRCEMISEMRIFRFKAVLTHVILNEDVLR